MRNQVHLCYGERQILLFNLKRFSILAKKKNLECHYNTIHGNKYDADFPPKSEIHKLKLQEFKSILDAQNQLGQGSFC
jgi:hypothetical protein